MSRTGFGLGPALGMALIVAGGLLIWWGYDQSRTLGHQLGEAVTGTISDEVMWKYIGGAAAAVAGLVLVGRR